MIYIKIRGKNFYQRNFMKVARRLWKFKLKENEFFSRKLYTIERFTTLKEKIGCCNKLNGKI